MQQQESYERPGVMMDEKDIETHLRQRLTHVDQLNDLAGPDLDVIVAQVHERQRSRHWIWVGAAAGSALAVLGAIIFLDQAGAGSGQPDRIASTSEAVPWINERAAATPASKDCESADLSLALGPSGAWHGLATQQINFINQGPDACLLRGLIHVSAEAPDGESSDVSTRGVVESLIELQPGETGWLQIGSPATCEQPVESQVAEQVDVSYNSGPTTSLDGGWIPLNCGSLQAVTFGSETLKEAPDLRLTAELTAPPEVVSGTTMFFTVILTNTGEKPFDFQPCPSYSEGLKPFGASESLMLNCDAVGPLAPQQSAKFEMQLSVPPDAAGQGLLTWALTEHNEVHASTSVEVR